MTLRISWRRRSRDLPDLALLRVTADHMCPECGTQPRAFCPVCYGEGKITSLELDIWQKRMDEHLGPEVGG